MRKSRIFRGQPRGSGDGGSDPFFCSPLKSPIFGGMSHVYKRLFMEGGAILSYTYTYILQNSRKKDI